MRTAFLAWARSGRERLAPPPESNPAANTTTTGVLLTLQRSRGNQFVQRVVTGWQSGRGRLVGLPQAEMVSEVLHRKGHGAPLPDGVARTMKGFFGANLERVRVHTDVVAGELAAELNARAFTVGSDVFFAPGEFADTTEGHGLLAHELTHVLQQTGPTAVQRQEDEGKNESSAPDPKAEVGEDLPTD